MTTITKERLLTIKQWRETYGPGSNVVLPAEEAEELARIALASLEAEPVAYIFKHPAGKLFWALTDESNKEQPDVIPVYADSPAPVVPDERAAFNAWNNDENLPIAGVGAKNAAWLAWQARAELGRSLAVNSPVTPDGWISCSERMPPQDDWILIYSKHGEYMAGQVQGEYVELSDGTLSWLGNALYWMLLPEPPQGVNDELA